MSVVFSDEELLALLCLPLFKIPNELSPFYQQQVDNVAQGHDPQTGLDLLEQKGCWSWETRELTMLGRQYFVPVFAPTARSFVYKEAHAPEPLQEFYVYEDIIVRFIPGAKKEITGPYSEHDLVEHFRRIFPDRRSPFTANKISLFEKEFIFLALVYFLLQEEKQVKTSDELFLEYQKRLHKGNLYLPVVGELTIEDFTLTEEDFAEIRSSLISEGLLENQKGVLQIPKSLLDLLKHVFSSREIFILREEMEVEEIYCREASLINGERGYILGRYIYNYDLSSYLVHLEDIEWHTLYRLINEVTRSLDYIEKLLLEVNSRVGSKIRI